MSCRALVAAVFVACLLVALVPSVTAQCEAVPGTYCPTAPSGIEECPPGYSSVVASSLCYRCPPGSFSNTSAAIACTQCEPGSYSSKSGQTVCARCALGFHTSNYNSTSCTPCPAGKRAISTLGATGCTDCEPGKYSAGGSAQCDLCASGTYANTTGSTGCPSCPAGTAQPDPGKSSCSSCDPGHSTYGRAGRVACAVCDPGTYALGGEPDCVRCPINKYQPDSGKSFCSDCFYVQFTTQTGSTVCSQCPAFQIRDIKAGKCVDGDNYPNTIASGGIATCESNFRSMFTAGRACEACPVDHYSDIDRCRPCELTWLRFIVLAAVFVLILVAAFAYPSKPTLTTGIRSLFFFLQSAALISSLHVGFSDSLVSALEFFSLTGLDFGLLSFSCYLPASAREFTTVYGGSWASVPAHYSILARLVVVILFVFAISALLSLLASLFSAARDSFKRAIALTLTLSYITLVQYGFSMWQCQNGHMRWDLRTSCDGDGFSASQFVGAFTLAVFGAGLPLAIITTSITKLNNLTTSAKQSEVNSFSLSGQYQPNFWAADSLPLVRTAIIVAGFQLPLDRDVQRAIAIFACGIYLLFIVIRRPYRGLFGNALEVISSVCLIAVYSITFATGLSHPVVIVVDTAHTKISDTLIGAISGSGLLLIALTLLAVLMERPASAASQHHPNQSQQGIDLAPTHSAPVSSTYA